MKSLALLACAGLAACATDSIPVFPPPLAATAAPRSSLAEAQAPAFAVDEAWEYRFESALDRAQNATYAQRAVKASDGSTELAVSGGRSGPASIDANANYTRFGSATYEPSDERLNFPLFVGKTWSASYVYRNGSWQSKCERQAKVVGVERVRTPGGLFEAFRIEEKTLWQTNDLYGGQGIARETLWYAPAAKRIVKGELLDVPLKGPAVSTLFELLSHVEPPTNQ
jgi:hypothetical protein